MINLAKIYPEDLQFIDNPGQILNAYKHANILVKPY